MMTREQLKALSQEQLEQEIVRLTDERAKVRRSMAGKRKALEEKYRVRIEQSQFHEAKDRNEFDKVEREFLRQKENWLFNKKLYGQERNEIMLDRTAAIAELKSENHKRHMELDMQMAHAYQEYRERYGTEFTTHDIEGKEETDEDQEQQAE